MTDSTDPKESAFANRWGPPKFFTERAPRGKSHAVWCPPDGPGMEPPEMPDRTACNLDITEEWEPESNREYPTCGNCERAVNAIYGEPVEKPTLKELEGSIRG